LNQRTSIQSIQAPRCLPVLHCFDEIHAANAGPHTREHSGPSRCQVMTSGIQVPLRGAPAYKICLRFADLKSHPYCVGLPPIVCACWHRYVQRGKVASACHVARQGLAAAGVQPSALRQGGVLRAMPQLSKLSGGTGRLVQEVLPQPCQHGARFSFFVLFTSQRSTSLRPNTLSQKLGRRTLVPE